MRQCGLLLLLHVLWLVLLPVLLLRLQALLFLGRFGRGQRCSCSSCWGSAPLPLYVHQQREAQFLLQALKTMQQQQQQQQQHCQQLLSEEQFDMQFALLR